MDYLSFDVGIKNLAYCILTCDEKIKQWGFSVNPYNKIVKGLEEIEKQHKYMEEKRSTLD